MSAASAAPRAGACRGIGARIQRSRPLLVGMSRSGWASAAASGHVACSGTGLIVAAGALALFSIARIHYGTTLPNGCTLLTLPVVVLPVVLDANGRFLLSLNVPAGVVGMINIQAAVVDLEAPGSFTLTNGTELTAN